jgi:hypothetical protein
LEPKRAAAGDDDLGAGQFRAVRLGQLFADESSTGRAARGIDRLDRRRSAIIAGCVESRAAHGDDLLGVGRFDRLDGVAGIDRALEGVGAMTAVMSESCITSSRAATRGHDVLALVVAGATIAS